MAQTNYSKNNGAAVRRPGVMTRAEYQSRRTEFAPRGQELPHTKLLEMDVISIRSAARQRAALRKHIDANLTNAALAKQYGVHERTVERIVSRELWSHLP